MRQSETLYERDFETMRIIGEGGQRIRIEKENVKRENGSDSVQRDRASGFIE